MTENTTLTAVPPIGSIVRLKSETKIAGFTITPSATGRVHIATQELEDDQVAIEFLGLDFFTVHPLSDLAPTYSTVTNAVTPGDVEAAVASRLEALTDPHLFGDEPDTDELVKALRAARSVDELADVAVKALARVRELDFQWEDYRLNHECDPS